MISRRPASYFLQDILDVWEECLGFVAGMTFSEFDRDPKTKRAVERDIEIIGEAAGKIPQAIRQSAPEIPWAKMMGMRIRLAHVYFDVLNEVVYSTAQEELPALRQPLERLLNQSGTERI